MATSATIFTPETTAEPGLLVLLHGLTGNHAVWGVRTDLQALADRFDLVIAVPDGARSFWIDQAFGLRWGTWVGSEFPEMLRRSLRISTARADTFVGGLSMGGYGAFRAALDYPQNFSGAFALSGTLDVAEIAFRGRHPDLYELGFGNSEHPRPQDDLVSRVLQLGESDVVVAGQVDIQAPAGSTGVSSADLRDHAAALNNHGMHKATGSAPAAERSQVRPPRLAAGENAASGAQHTALDLRYFAVCGTEDRLLEQNRRFAEAAGSAGLNLKYQEGPGQHDFRFWNEWLPKALNYLRG